MSRPEYYTVEHRTLALGLVLDHGCAKHDEADRLGSQQGKFKHNRLCRDRQPATDVA